jgi:dTDP-4-dehydrorhamnose reductase
VRIALTGSDGMLGSAIQRVFHGNVDLVNFSLNDFDITDLDAAVSKIRDAAPDYLIHTAAYTDVDGCEKHPEEAFRINGIGTRNIAMACEDIKCPLMYISTDYVFDGTKGSPYNEWDSPNPINQYGTSKLLGEHYVMALTNRFYIVRTSWLYGGNGNNFVDTISGLLSVKDEIEVVNDQVGSPTLTGDLALKLKELVGGGYGIYHITNASHCSWYEFAMEIGKSRPGKAKISPTTTDRFNRPARRPSYSVLDNAVLRLDGRGELRHWKEALKDYLGT